MRSIASLSASILLLSGCASGPVAVACPDLAPPPMTVVDALADVARADGEAAAWVIGLDKHYSKLETCS